MIDQDRDDPAYYEPRRCLREPIPEIFESADLLSRAAGAHLAGETAVAARLIRAADQPAIRDWIESLWGPKSKYPEKVHFLRVREAPEATAALPTPERVKSRGPTPDIAMALIDRFGWNCAYCGIPLIDRRARNLLIAAYSDALRWGRTNDSKHTAFMCMDNEFDHVIPHSHGGSNDIENLVPCCAPCNCGKENWTLEQLGLIDPRTQQKCKSNWDGLTRLL